MKVFIASDHAGFLMKQYLLDNGGDFIDLGTDSSVSCDYPIFANKVAERMKATENSRGVLICGSGIGMAIAANRHRHLRAALCLSEYMAQISRRHNDANVIVFGANIMDGGLALNCMKIFLETPFDGGRHAARLDIIR
ncbi:MAG: ribose 5-phosphate isomerase B [Holosporaceae bacterium]|jgi:ribose 5-phosphate isomerase B|nr:ribose 5-phosphate isomerase B [Holosporaceae bacterium]